MIKKLIAILALALCGAQAQASTDCTGTVAYVTEYGVGSTPTLYVALSGTSNVGFLMLDSDASYKGVAALSSLARVMGTSVTITFAASGVTCNPGSFAWRSDMTAFHF